MTGALRVKKVDEPSPVVRKDVTSIDNWIPQRSVQVIVSDLGT